MEKARRRQIEAGKSFGRGQEEKLPSKLKEALGEEPGEAMEIAAKKVGLEQGHHIND